MQGGQQSVAQAAAGVIAEGLLRGLEAPLRQDHQQQEDQHADQQEQDLPRQEGEPAAAEERTQPFELVRKERWIHHHDVAVDLGRVILVEPAQDEDLTGHLGPGSQLGVTKDIDDVAVDPSGHHGIPEDHDHVAVDLLVLVHEDIVPELDGIAAADPPR
jgi:hypothetical protein